MEIGVYTFAELRPDPEDRIRLTSTVSVIQLLQYEIFGHDRFLAQISVGDLPHDKVLRAIELLGTVVAPAVREEVASGTRA